MDFHVGAALIDFLVFRQVAEIELRVDALRKHVEPYCYDIEVACALTVAEQRALNPVRSREKRKLRRGDAASAVVMRMDADNGGFAVWEMADKVFHLVGIGVCGAHFDCIRKIQDDRFSFAAPSASMTAAQISTENSGSVPLKLSGEYSKRMFVSPL